MPSAPMHSELLDRQKTNKRRPACTAWARLMASASRLWKAVKRAINIWRLHRWAKRQGYVRNTTSNIERWDDPHTGEWRLKIKRAGSTRPGLQPGSRAPRADARVGRGAYINPLTGQTGKNAGTHI